MNNIEQNRDNLTEAGLEMFHLCEMQLRSTQQAFYTLNHDLAEEVIHLEKRINALGIQIERECEWFLALHRPMGYDLRVVLGLRKIIFGLERIGGHCYSISKLTSEMKELPNKVIPSMLEMNEMFASTISMMQDISRAYQEGDSTKLRKIFGKKIILEDNFRKSFNVVPDEVRKNTAFIDQYLVIFSLMKNLEATGSFIINIAEEVIFYCEAGNWRQQQVEFEWD